MIFMEASQRMVNLPLVSLHPPSRRRGRFWENTHITYIYMWRGESLSKGPNFGPPDANNGVDDSGTPLSPTNVRPISAGSDFPGPWPVCLKTKRGLIAWEGFA